MRPHLTFQFGAQGAGWLALKSIYLGLEDQTLREEEQQPTSTVRGYKKGLDIIPLEKESEEQWLWMYWETWVKTGRFEKVGLDSEERRKKGMDGVGKWMVSTTSGNSRYAWETFKAVGVAEL